MKNFEKFRDTQSVPFMLDMTGNHFFLDWEQNIFLKVGGISKAQK